eukprot:168375-Chlamydomonas_euryale.AAC.2
MDGWMDGWMDRWCVFVANLVGCGRLVVLRCGCVLVLGHGGCCCRTAERQEGRWVPASHMQQLAWPTDRLEAESNAPWQERHLFPRLECEQCARDKGGRMQVQRPRRTGAGGAHLEACRVHNRAVLALARDALLDLQQVWPALKVGRQFGSGRRRCCHGCARVMLRSRRGGRLPARAWNGGCCGGCCGGRTRLKPGRQLRAAELAEQRRHCRMRGTPCALGRVDGMLRQPRGRRRARKQPLAFAAAATASVPSELCSGHGRGGSRRRRRDGLEQR